MASTTSYIINFNKKTGVFTLTSTKDEVKVDAKHKKYEWLKSQDTGRIVKISDKGRWNSSKDYIGLYDEINSSSSKKKTHTKRKTKSIEAIPSNLKINELATLKETILHLKNKLQLREKEWKGLLKAKEYDKQVIYQLKQLGSERKKEIQLLKTKSTSLTNEIQLLKKKSQSVKLKPKPKPVKKLPKKYKARMTATLSFTDFFTKEKVTEFLPHIEIYTEKLDKKPSQSFFKTYCKLVANKGRTYHMRYKLGMPIQQTDGFKMYKIGSLGKNVKITNISFKSIEEY